MTFPALAVSYVACVRPPGGRVPTVRRDTTWPDLADALTRPPPVREDVIEAAARAVVCAAAACKDLDPVAAEKAERALRLPAWSPATFDPAWRSNANARAVSCIVLDHDDGAPLDLARRTWGAWAHVVHTSWSHASTAARWRVVVPLARPVSVALWPRVWAWAHARVDGRADAACKDPSRLYYLPALRSPDAPWGAAVHDGPALDLDAVDLDAVEPVRRTAARVRARPRSTVPRDDRLRELGRLLRVDRDARERLAGALGADVTGTPPRADRVTCPRCGRPSVWWWLEPGPMAGAACKHRNTCGWAGSLVDLAWSVTP